jgi:hypothetical protein
MWFLRRGPADALLISASCLAPMRSPSHRHSEDLKCDCTACSLWTDSNFLVQMSKFSATSPDVAETLTNSESDNTISIISRNTEFKSSKAFWFVKISERVP